MRVVTDIKGLDRVAGPGVSVTTYSRDAWPKRRSRILQIARAALHSDYLVVHFELPEILFFTWLFWFLPFSKCRLVTLDFFVARPKSWQIPLVGWSLRRIDRMLVYFRNSRRFEERYGVPAKSFCYIPFKINSWELARKAPISDGGYIFVGGRSRRDFRTLFEAVRGLDFPVKILTAPAAESALAGSSLAGLTVPPNVEIFENDTDSRFFVELMANSRMVVIPVVADSEIQAGIGVYLLGMALRKCVVISTALGVDDVLLNGEACIVQAGDASALRAAVTKLWEDGGLRDRFAEAGYRYASPLGGEENLFRSVLQAIGAATTADPANGQPPPHSEATSGAQNNAAPEGF